MDHDSNDGAESKKDSVEKEDVNERTDNGEDHVAESKPDGDGSVKHKEPPGVPADIVDSANTSSRTSPETVESKDQVTSEDSRDSSVSKDQDCNATEANTDSISENPGVISDKPTKSPSDKSSTSSESNKKDSLVETVKDGDEDILITLNEEDDEDKKDEVKTEDGGSAVDEVVAEKKSKEKDKKPSDVKQELPAPPPLTPAPGVLPQTSSAAKTQNTQPPTIGIPITGMPAGATLAQQGSQLGYITTLGKQTLFVPISVPAMSSSLVLNQLATQQKSTSKPSSQTVTQQQNQQPQPPRDLKPKSSWEMLELMRWEVQNRVPDNWNWSVVFHPRKEELSSITSFLQELGSDVVKEQVYKDIIQIQTKKKQAGELKEAEVDSLEKMKTVYDNTKKKVEHLQLETLTCSDCDFKTESALIMEHHKDFPHYEPPWDINKGYMHCSHCNYRTRVIAQFIFHMMDMHKRQAKFLEKDQYFQCALCPMNASSKPKLEKHQGKCMKHFKLHVNLQPYFHDVNFCMKTCFYKPKKPPAPKPAPPPPKPAPRPTASITTRQQAAIGQPQVQQPPRPVVRPPTPAAPRAPAPNQTLRPVQQTTPAIARPTFPRPTRPQGKEMSGFEVCEMCGGYVKDRQALRIHFYYAHKVELPQAVFQRDKPPLACDVCKAQFWTTQGLTKHKMTQRHFSSNTGTAVNSNSVGANQQCFMCLRKVGNLFLHVEQMHGMTMKDLVLMKKCIICGITAADRRSLEVHMASSHGILIKASDYVTEKAPANQQNSSAPPSAGPKQGKNIGKINFCVFCEIQFPDNIQLTVHCMKKHATCKECGMVVVTAAHLDKHKCMKANRKCFICGLKNMTPDSYAIHLKRHIKSCKVDLENLSTAQIEKAKEKLKREYKPAVISLDSDEDSDVEVVENTKPSNMKVIVESSTTDQNSDKNGKDENNSEKEPKEENKTEEFTNDKCNESTENGESKTEKATDEAEEVDATNLESKDISVKEESKDDNESLCDKKQDEQMDNEQDGEKPLKTEDEGLEMESKNNNDKANGEDIYEDKLLGDSENSNESSGSLKRKRLDFDIDEDELLKDDSEPKRPKLEESKDEIKTETSAEDMEIGETEETDVKKVE